jgi:hypothetical protein
MAACNNFTAAPLSRRDMLRRCANGFGAVALASLLSEEFRGDVALGSSVPAASPDLGPYAVRPPHFKARARNVIFLYMDGGPSQIDTFDPKPRLNREHGKPFGAKMEPTQFNNNGSTLGCPWAFHQYGQSGIPVSDLFPHIAQHVDDMTIVRSLVSEFSEHTAANYFLHTGSGLQGRPSMGSWVTYGLGSECRDLPGFIVLNGGLIPVGGLDNFNNGFLPATYQASIFRPANPPVANIRPLEASAALQRNKLDLLHRLDRLHTAAAGTNDAVESAIANYETAFRMQRSAPDLVDLSGETAQTRRNYGLESQSPEQKTYGTACLLARRLVERGVRFVEVTCPKVSGGDRWDQHSGLKVGHEQNAFVVDQPIGALLGDLKARGLLDTTLVVWAGEFGRTPFAQGSDGRDHNPFGFTVWLAGGGVKPGTIYGATDDYGYKTVAGRVEMHDLHATMLHLLGLDHKRVTFRFGGRDMRLTDVHGNVVREILA